MLLSFAAPWGRAIVFDVGVAVVKGMVPAVIEGGVGVPLLLLRRSLRGSRLSALL